MNAYILNNTPICSRLAKTEAFPTSMTIQLVSGLSMVYKIWLAVLLESDSDLVQ